MMGEISIHAMRIRGTLQQLSNGCQIQLRDISTGYLKKLVSAQYKFIMTRKGNIG